MKKATLLPLLLLFLTSCALAQKNAFKAGINLQSSYADVDHKLGNKLFAGYEIAYERGLGNKFSVGLGYNFTARNYTMNYNEDIFSIPYPLSKITKYYDHSIVSQARFYLKSFNEGLFIQAGIPFTYSVEKSYSSFLQGKSVFTNSFHSLGFLGGIGIKYSLLSRIGIEMDCSIDPTLNLFEEENYGTSGFFKTGLRVLYNL